MTEVEVALEELIEKEDAAETEQRVVDSQKKMNSSQDRKCREHPEEGYGKTWTNSEKTS